MPSPRQLITKKIGFSASHRYWNKNWSEEKNHEFYGKSSLASSHGHNFTLEVTVQGEINPETGMIINLFDLKEILCSVIGDFDHKNLNEDHPAFQDIVPTTENIAKVLWDAVEQCLLGRSNCSLYNVRVYETDELFVDYSRR